MLSLYNKTKENPSCIFNQKIKCIRNLNCGTCPIAPGGSGDVEDMFNKKNINNNKTKKGKVVYKKNKKTINISDPQNTSFISEVDFTKTNEQIISEQEYKKDVKNKRKSEEDKEKENCHKKNKDTENNVVVSDDFLTNTENINLHIHKETGIQAGHYNAKTVINYCVNKIKIFAMKALFLSKKKVIDLELEENISGDSIIELRNLVKEQEEYASKNNVVLLSGLINLLVFVTYNRLSLLINTILS